MSFCVLENILNGFENFDQSKSCQMTMTNFDWLKFKLLISNNEVMWND